MSDEINELNRNIDLLMQKVATLEHKKKVRKGVMKEGEWYLLNCKGENQDDSVVFYRAPQGIVCMNAYFEWYSDYIYDLLGSAPYFEKWSGKKVSKEEAIKYL